MAVHLLDHVALLPIVLSEHPGPIAVGLLALTVWLLFRYGALPRFPARPAVTTRTAAQAAEDAQRSRELRIAAARIKQDRRRVVHPIVTFEREHARLSGVQRRLRRAGER